MKSARRHALLIFTAGLAACGAPAVSIATSLPSTLHSESAHGAAVIASHVWVQEGQSPHTTVAVVDTVTRSTSLRLPMGEVAPDWSRMYSVVGSASAPTLQEIDPATGVTVASIAIQAGFDLPAVIASGRPEGLSPDGRRLVLAGGTPAADGGFSTSRFLVYDTAALYQSPLVVSLNGNFTFDGISNDGRNLYLLEDLAPTTSGAYHVRRYDLVAARLDPTVLSDKRTGERSITGAAIDRATSVDGAWQLTVYGFGSGAPFVHALDLNDSTSFCIDLPPTTRGQELDLLWGLVASHDGRYVYAINAASGAVVEMPAATPWQTRQASLPLPSTAMTSAWTPWAPITAEAKRIAFGAAAISPDDATLYSLGEQGVLVVNTADLKARRALLPSLALDSLVLSPNGRVLYAVTPGDGSTLLQVDVQNGNWTSIDGVRDLVSVLRVTT
jgi:DNA-binding beta-propeller fold protein YncE